jgi:transmembrane sensor
MRLEILANSIENAKKAPISIVEGRYLLPRAGAAVIIFPAGAYTRAFIAPDKAVVSIAGASKEIDNALAWRTGQLVFDGDTVAEAVAEFNRYNVRKIELSDAALGQKKMIGRFRTNEPDAFAHAVEILTDSRAIITAERIILSSD